MQKPKRRPSFEKQQENKQEWNCESLVNLTVKKGKAPHHITTNSFDIVTLTGLYVDMRYCAAMMSEVPKSHFLKKMFQIFGICHGDMGFSKNKNVTHAND
jgi:hypothetical protein